MSDNATLEVYRILHQAVKICVAKGIAYAVLSPGSRSAPLALSFLRNPGIKTFVIPDERSAAYVALGIAKSTGKPVALVCTSGTAALNYGPAVAEAYFSEVPLLVMTTDRPPEWLGQADNQAIFQHQLYGAHAKAFFAFPVGFYHADEQWHALRIVNEAINIASSGAKGPVHINVPLREPLYLPEEPVFEEVQPQIISHTHTLRTLPPDLLEEIKGYKRILVVAGMMNPDADLAHSIEAFCENSNAVCLPDITSNLLHIENAIPNADLLLEILDKDKQEELVPELLISFGGPLVSKSLKQFLRSKKIKAHWHISEKAIAADTFQNLSRIVDIAPQDFFATVSEATITDTAYEEQWLNLQSGLSAKLEKAIGGLPYSELKAVKYILDAMPENSVLHLGNSLPIRHVSILGKVKNNVEVFSNRGTSGIDGSLSTAVGQSFIDNRIHTVLLGDLSFMYDRNGLWNNYLRSNLKIIIFNNHGGGIFRTLPGPVKQKELESYFVVEQPLSFEHTALQHNCMYLHCENEAELGNNIKVLYAENEKPVIVEIDFKGKFTVGQLKELLAKV
jgi:2-succinyl-5-enolpyruvyl-6-hydroxy-3-cyclohexene-1-carboxylate synthase